QVLDDGRLTDGQGHIVDFRNTVIIMTSNIGSHRVDFSKDYDAVHDEIETEIKNHFRPEFINRLDDIIVFRKLNENEIEKIVKIQLETVRKRAKEYGIQVDFSEKIIKNIAKEGFSDEYGARPIRRMIQNLIENKLSQMIISGEIKKNSKPIVF
ncbi:MAG: hypothetical protein COX48_06060, partial [bacterium (Candidatus Stahlbacteria) CG23_combo_of_CG06-09_8_20_14_all_34_7]